MSTPISDGIRAAVAAAALVSLAACEGGAGGGAVTRTTVRVGGAPVIVAAPAGFCVDQRSTDSSAAGAFVLVTDCTLLGRRTPEGGPPIGAAMTASISAPEPGTAPVTLADLEGYAATPQGRALLGRSGRGDAIRILETVRRGDVLYMLVEDRGPQPIAGVDPRFWRAFMEVDGRIAALSVLGFQGSGIDAQTGFGFISAFAANIDAANG